jgi:hypothetical protein
MAYKNAKEIKCFPVGVYFPQITLNNITTSCYGQSTGGVDISVSGATFGSSPYSWSNGSSSQDLVNVPTGTYNITVTDIKGCSWAETFTVPTYPEIFVSLTSENTCEGYSVGSINTTVSGGKPPYSYHWSNGSTSSNLSSLAEGTYTLSLTDDNGCTEIKSVTLAAPEVTETVNPNDCRYTDLWCNGNIIDTKFYGTYFANDPNDCRYINEYCSFNEQIYVYHTSMGNPPLTASANAGSSCILNFTCSDGSLYSSYTGINQSGYFGWVDQFGTPRCDYVEYCTYSLPGMIEPYTNIWNVIPSTVTDQIAPNDVGCPSGTIRKEYLCNGVVFAFFCEPITKPSSGYDNSELIIHSAPTKGLIKSATYNITKDIINFLSGEIKPPIIEIIEIGSNNIEVFPNPFDNEINIKITSEVEENIKISLNDALGKMIMIRNFQLSEGQQIIRIETDKNLPKGVYFLTIEYQDGKQESVKVIH